MRPLTEAELNQAKLMAAIARGRASAESDSCSYVMAIVQEWQRWHCEDELDPRISTTAFDLALDHPFPPCSGD